MATKNNPFMPGVAPQMSGPFATTSPKAGPTQMPGNSTAGAADTFEVDLTNVDNSGGFRVPEGTYRAKLIEVEQSVSKGGNPMFVWTFEISAGEQAGFQLKSFTAITPAAMWKVAEIVEALGVGQTGSVVKFKRSDVINRECGLAVEDQEYNGSVRSSIVKVISVREIA